MTGSPEPPAGEGFRYVERDGVERFLALPERSGGDRAASGGGARNKQVVATGTSAAVREYNDKLKAIHLQQQGLSRAEVARKLERSEHWVKRWWRQTPELIPRPHGAQDGVFRRTPLIGFRDVEIQKDFAQNRSLFETLVDSLDWKQGKVTYRDELTNELVLRFDEQGRSIPAKRMVSDYRKGIAPLDALLQKAFFEASIRDPQARVVLNLYTDGTKQLNAHRHDYWTCLISLGAPRILSVDHQPVLLEDGDMIVFGTQMHGVPAMPDITGGRISVVIFFYPDRDNLERRWLTILPEEIEDRDETGLAARELQALDSAVDSETKRRDGWRKTNSELYGDRPELPGGSTIYSIGCTYSSDDGAFFRTLAAHSIGLLWDLRPPEDVRDAIREGRTAAAFGLDSLREKCRGRVRYRSWPMGTRRAGGLVPHLHATEEGASMLWRLHQASLKENVCVLGLDEDWRRDDARVSVACALVELGVRVAHLRTRLRDGAPLGLRAS